MSGGQHSVMHTAEVEQALGLPEGGVLAMPGQTALNAPFGSLHHVALVTNDMKKTVAFYRDVLGSEVAMGHRLPRTGNERHYFITVAPTTVFAFFEFPDAEMPPTKRRRSRARAARSITLPSSRTVMRPSTAGIRVWGRRTWTISRQCARWGRDCAPSSSPIRTGSSSK